MSLTPSVKPYSASSLQTASPASVYQQTFFLNKLGSCNVDLEALHVDVSLAESELDLTLKKYNTDAKKINWLLVCFDKPIKAWAAKLFIKKPELKINYKFFFAQHLLKV